MFKTIRTRLALWYLALLALILCAFSAALYFTLARALDERTDAALALAAQRLVDKVNTETTPIQFVSGGGGPTDVKTARAGGNLVRLVDAAGRVVDTNETYATLPVETSSLDAARRGATELVTVTAQGERFRLYTIPVTENEHFVGTLQVAEPLAKIELTLQQLALTLALIVPLTLVIATFSGVWFARRALAPMDTITRAAQRIRAQNLNERLNLRLPDDEVGRLARTFDEMLARLHDQFQREREFTANASHELRTPLTIMRGEIDVARARPRSAPEYERALDELGREVDRLTQLTQDLLTLARADAGALPLNFETVPAREILAAVKKELQPVAAAQRIELETRAEDSLFARCDPERLHQILRNVTENAIKFSAPHRRVLLSVTRDAEHIAFRVQDSGVGISHEHLARITERFYRVAQQGAHGAGLGLAIANALTRAQGGTLEVASEVGEGTRVTVKLPIKEL